MPEYAKNALGTCFEEVYGPDSHPKASTGSRISKTTFFIVFQ